MAALSMTWERDMKPRTRSRAGNHRLSCPPVFTAPILPEEIAGVRVWNDNAEELWIDVK